MNLIGLDLLAVEHVFNDLRAGVAEVLESKPVKLSSRRTLHPLPRPRSPLLRRTVGPALKLARYVENSALEGVGSSSQESTYDRRRAG